MNLKHQKGSFVSFSLRISIGRNRKGSSVEYGLKNHTDEWVNWTQIQN